MKFLSLTVQKLWPTLKFLDMSTKDQGQGHYFKTFDMMEKALSQRMFMWKYEKLYL